MNESGEHSLNPPLRASDAERDRAVARLQHHFAVGRLALPEMEERVGAAYEARTREQLDALLRDLPGETAASARSDPARSDDVIDSRLLIILLYCAPPAALVYWLVSRREARRRAARRRAVEAAEGPRLPDGARRTPLA